MMKEIDKAYFLSISKLVMKDEYNRSTYNTCTSIDFNDDLGQSDHLKIKSSLAHDGFCILQLNSAEPMTPDIIGSKFLKLFDRPFRDKHLSDSFYTKVTAERNAKFYVNSHLAQPIHTDEGYTNEFPRYSVLYSAQEAETGGDSIIVLFEPLYTELINKFQADIHLLFENDAITAHHAQGIEKKPILLRLNNSQIGISYSPVLKKMWCSNRVFELFDYITQYVHSINNQLRFKLKQGQALVFDNCTVLHGRTAFPKNDKRLLYRYWFEDNSLC